MNLISAVKPTIKVTGVDNLIEVAKENIMKHTNLVDQVVQIDKTPLEGFINQQKELSGNTTLFGRRCCVCIVFIIFIMRLIRTAITKFTKKHVLIYRPFPTGL